MRKLSILLFILFFSNLLYSQSIIGSITGAEWNKEYNIVIKKNNIVVADILSQKGNFKYNKEVTAGNYILEIYDKSTLLKKKNISLNSKENKLIVDLSQQIEEVIIQSNKFIDLRSDRLVYSLANSPFKDGFNSFEVLKKVPFLIVNDDKVSIVGKGDMTFTINDKRVSYSEQELIEYLKTIPSENIDKIEVITNPPTKYDSYGNGGVVNIKLKRPKDDLGLILSSSYIQRTNPNYSNNLNFNYSKNKVSLNVNVSYLKNQLQNDYRYLLTDPNDFFKQGSTERSIVNNDKLSSSLNFNYKLNNNTDIGLLYDFFYSTTDNTTDKRIFQSDGSSIEDNSKYSNNSVKNVLNLYSDIKIDTLGSKLSLLANYINNNANDSNDLGNYLYNNNNDLKNNIYAFQGDLTLVRKKVDFNTGFNVNRFTNDIINDSNQGSNIFNYREFIYNTYFDIDFTINERFSLKGGLKYENWTRDINEIKINNNYLFPTLNLSYKLNKKNSFTLSYSKRLVKPYLSYLNPYRIYTTENSYFTGNPYLNAYTVNNIDFRYAYNSVLFFNLYSNFNKDVYGSITKFEGDGHEVRTYDNYYSSSVYGTSISYFYRKIKWFDSQLYYNLYYVDSNVRSDFQSKNGFVNVLYADSNFYLKKDKSTFLSLSYFISLPYKAVNNENRTNASFSASFKTNLVKDLLTLSIAASDIFKQQGEKRTTFFSNSDKQSYYRYNDFRRVSITLTYKIGKRKNSKRIDNNDRIEGQ